MAVVALRCMVCGEVPALVAVGVPVDGDAGPVGGLCNPPCTSAEGS